MFHDKNVHIKVDFYFIDENLILIIQVYVRINHQLVDLLTKDLEELNF